MYVFLYEISLYLLPLKGHFQSYLKLVITFIVLIKLSVVFSDPMTSSMERIMFLDSPITGMTPYASGNKPMKETSSTLDVFSDVENFNLPDGQVIKP